MQHLSTGHDHAKRPVTFREIRNNTMIEAIARAFRWQRLLENGSYGCLDEIAKAERIGPSFVSRAVRLALLAPDIVEAILAGKQPASLTVKDLRGCRRRGGEHLLQLCHSQAGGITVS